jgi:hypothetical protein
MNGQADPVRAFYESISNWGRWGTDDQRGTLNPGLVYRLRHGG